MKKPISFPSSRGQRSPVRAVLGTAVLLAVLALGNTGASAALGGNRYTTSEITLGTMHVGAGYLVSITEALKLNLYGRYVLSYLDGDDVGLHTGNGETFSMDSTVTHAFRLGARLNGNFCDNAAWRFGLAYEHVADGDAESDVLAEGTRAALDVPTLEGDTGIMELGVTMTPSATSPWSFDVGLKGYVGDRRGVSGSALVTYAF